MQDEKTEALALPGMEELVRKLDLRPGEEDMTDEKKFTGEVLFRDHPDVFKAVAAAFFIDRLSCRSIAARFRVSVNTVRTIRDMALSSSDSIAGRAAFFIKSKADTLHGIILNRSLEELYDRLSDPEKAKKIPVDTLLQIANQTAQTNKSSIPAASQNIDADEFDNIINGLERKKKSAGEIVDADLVTDESHDETQNTGCHSENQSKPLISTEQQETMKSRNS